MSGFSPVDLICATTEPVEPALGLERARSDHL